MSGHTATPFDFSKTRCDGGTLYRHDPCPDDPYFEMEIGQCPKCGGRGCERRPDTVTIVLPSGYATAEEFAKDCGFELSDSRADLVTMREKLEAARDALQTISNWRSVNIGNEYEHGLRDIIRSIVDCASQALDDTTVYTLPALDSHADLVKALEEIRRMAITGLKGDEEGESTLSNINDLALIALATLTARKVG